MIGIKSKHGYCVVRLVPSLSPLFSVGATVAALRAAAVAAVVMFLLLLSLLL